ncbi:unnamed protein product [Microthlaspi erraticum]|nr:unnamed protein product [Microthlaspi erraticum]
MLMYPKSKKEVHCRKLKLNMDDTAHSSKFFVCPKFYKHDSCSRYYSNFTTSKCSCGGYMTKEVRVPEELQAGYQVGNGVDGVFVCCRSSFIVTDDLKVTLNSIGAIANVLKDLGYQGFRDMQEMIIQVGFQEVVALLGCLFTTNAPLTYSFLRKDIVTLTDATLSPSVQEIGHEQVQPGFQVKVFVRKCDRKILYVESSEDFIDSLLTFLVLPLEMAWSFSDDNTILECVRNLHRSEARRALTPDFSELPDYYPCRNRLLDIKTSPLPKFECCIPKDSDYCSVFNFTRPINLEWHMLPQDTVIVSSKDKYDDLMRYTDGFLRRGTKFIVSDDLLVTTMNSSSTIELLRKNQVDISDIEELAISISKAELISILRASLISSSALTKGLSNFLTRKPKEET